MKKWKRAWAWVFAVYSLAGIAGWVLFLGAMGQDWRPRWKTPEAAHGVPSEAAQWEAGMYGVVLP